MLRLQHGFQVICHPEWCLSLGLDLIHCDAIGNLNERESVGEIDIEDTLLPC